MGWDIIARGNTFGDVHWHNECSEIQENIGVKLSTFYKDVQWRSQARALPGHQTSLPHHLLSTRIIKDVG